MHFIMLIGCSGSGKSTLVADIVRRRPNTVVISSDEIIEDYAREVGISYQEAYPIMKDAARDICLQTAEVAFEQGRNVIWDQTNIKREERRDRLSLVPDSYEKIGVYLVGSRDALRARIESRHASGGRDIPAFVTDQQLADFALPDFDEGFDRLMMQTVGED